MLARVYPDVMAPSGTMVGAAVVGHHLLAQRYVCVFVFDIKKI